MDNWLERTELLLGKEKLDLLRQAHVLVVGLGGVGAYAAEMIARAGVGRMTIADADTVAPSNINRQLVALHSTVGRQKAEVLADRLRDINPAIGLTIVNRYIRDEETYTLLDAAAYDFAHAPQAAAQTGRPQRLQGGILARSDARGGDDPLRRAEQEVERRHDLLHPGAVRHRLRLGGDPHADRGNGLTTKP